jgi:prepilin-type N-terminal cleavage/methylation domain-containing protein
VHERVAQRGFTIIELMIVVAIIAVLAIVVIPSFIKESKRTKSQSEVQPMISTRSNRTRISLRTRVHRRRARPAPS